MGFLNKLFGNNKESSFIPKKNQTSNYEEFWNWFTTKEQDFYQIVKAGNNIEKFFFDVIGPKLKNINEGIYFLTGMKNDSTAELILTPDGVVKNIALIEDFVAAAPSLPNWIFTALKPASVDIQKNALNMGAYSFGNGNLFFYSKIDENYPDEIDITVVYKDFQEKNKHMITNAVYVFLDNYLGELNVLTKIDYMEVISENQATEPLVSIEKLNNYLMWREKEFIEKYGNISYNTDNDVFSSLEATLNNGLPLIAVVDSTLLNWDQKASHPWMLRIIIQYNGSNNNGFPDKITYKNLDDFEDEILLELKDTDGYLNIGRETADSERTIFVACKEFRKPSRVLEKMKTKYLGKIQFDYKISKDKYWRSVEIYQQN